MLKFKSIKFTHIMDAEALLYQLCLAFIIAYMLYHFDLLLFLKIETNAFDFAISRILFQ